MERRLFYSTLNAFVFRTIKDKIPLAVVSNYTEYRSKVIAVLIIFSGTPDKYSILKVKSMCLIIMKPFHIMKLSNLLVLNMRVSHWIPQLIKMSTTVLDIILNTPLKLLSSNATKEEFFSCTNLSDQLKIAYDVLNPYYSMNLESCWPRTYRQVSFGIKIETQKCLFCSERWWEKCQVQNSRQQHVQ